MSMNNRHKGDPLEAMVMCHAIMASETSLRDLNQELFNELNFTEEQLLEISDKVSNAEDTELIENHPNTTMRVKAKLLRHRM